MISMMRIVAWKKNISQGNKGNTCYTINPKSFGAAMTKKSGQLRPKLNQGNEIDDKINYQKPG